MRNLKVSNDRTLTLTPVLTGPDNNVVLPEIVINGRRRQKAYLRAIALDKATTIDRKSTRLNSSHIPLSRMPSSA